MRQLVSHFFPFPSFSSSPLITEGMTKKEREQAKYEKISYTFVLVLPLTSMPGFAWVNRAMCISNKEITYMRKIVSAPFLEIE